MPKPLPQLDIVLSIYNQEYLIERVLYGIFKNTTTPFNLILVFDGCIDRTKSRALRYLKKYSPKLLQKLITTDTPNIFETRANNVGFKLAETDHLITLQDDMVVNEYGWERRLTYPLRKFNDVMAVTSRTAQDIKSLDTDIHQYTHQASRETGTLPRTVFAVRDVINRGPIAFRIGYLKELHYLNEAYAPSYLDDADLSLRAWKDKKLRVGSFWIDYISRPEWGKTRSKDSTMILSKFEQQHGIQIMTDHADYLKSNQKHTEDIIISEREIDYLHTTWLPNIFSPFRYPIRTNCKQIRDTTSKTISFTIHAVFKLLGVKDSKEKGVKKAIFSIVKK